MDMSLGVRECECEVLEWHFPLFSFSFAFSLSHSLSLFLCLSLSVACARARSDSFSLSHSNPLSLTLPSPPPPPPSPLPPLTLILTKPPFWGGGEGGKPPPRPSLFNINKLKLYSQKTLLSKVCSLNSLFCLHVVSSFTCIHLIIFLSHLDLFRVLWPCLFLKGDTES